MSADAKVWQDDEGGWLSWRGSHDGPCNRPTPHDQGSNLFDLLEDIGYCMGTVRWEFRVYPDGKAGLVGYTT